MRIDSWNSESPELEVVEKPPSPKRARIDHQPGPPVTRLVGRSRTLSSSSTFSMTDSHGSTPSVDSGFGRGFDVSRNLITSPMVLQVCVVFVSLFVFFVRSDFCFVCFAVILILVLFSVVFCSSNSAGGEEHFPDITGREIGG